MPSVAVTHLSATRSLITLTKLKDGMPEDLADTLKANEEGPQGPTMCHSSQAKDNEA